MYLSICGLLLLQKLLPEEHFNKFTYLNLSNTQEHIYAQLIQVKKNQGWLNGRTEFAVTVEEI